MKSASSGLADRDRTMARLVGRFGPCRLPSRRKVSHFAYLARSIIYQQLAGKAAAAIHARFVQALRGDVTPERVRATARSRLRAAGLSENKFVSIRDLAARVADGSVPIDSLPRWTDQAIVDNLVQIRGIGPWTAEMFLMFQLRRLDVWPVLDFGVRKGYGLAFGHAEMPTSRQLVELGEPFRPYRSLAAWYCWRIADAGGWQDDDRTEER